VVLPTKERIDNKIARARYVVDYLLDRSKCESKWQFTSDRVESYRRMMVPFYLLNEECHPYPTYTDNSTINAGLTQNHLIKRIKVAISDSVFMELM
jgi:hypothetical protein